VSKDAGIEPRTAATTALAARGSHSARSHPLTVENKTIKNKDKTGPHSFRHDFVPQSGDKGLPRSRSGSTCIWIRIHTEVKYRELIRPDPHRYQCEAECLCRVVVFFMSYGEIFSSPFLSEESIMCRAKRPRIPDPDPKTGPKQSRRKEKFPNFIL
jgi:hypothetical protein